MGACGTTAAEYLCRQLDGTGSSATVYRTQACLLENPSILPRVPHMQLPRTVPTDYITPGPRPLNLIRCVPFSFGETGVI